MVIRNQFVIGIITGVVVSMIILGVLQLNRGPTPAQAAIPLAAAAPPPAVASVANGSQSATRDDGADILRAINSAGDGAAAQQPQFTPLPAISGLLPSNSKNHQADDVSLADYLHSKVRVLCWIMTSPDNLEKKARHVYKTWAHKCNVILFVSSEENKDFPAPVIKVDTEEGREHLTAKTMHAFKHIYDAYFDQADWFMKADDDTFAILENLRYFLSDKSPLEPVYYGHHFQTIVKPQGYYSGGGGYVLSREALKRFAERGFHQNSICREDGGAEDAEFGKCMQNLGVHTAESYDERGGSRFHCFNPGTHIHGGYPDWYKQYDSHGATYGVDKISDYPITFHYVNPEEMYSLAWYTYHLKVYGHANKAFPVLDKYYLQPRPDNKN